MTVRYHSRHGHLWLEYVCQREGIEHAEPVCQRVPGVGIDQAMGDLLVETVNPVALEVTPAVQRELQSRIEEADRLRHKQVERAQSESDLAQRRCLRVDPDNRLVADSLEADWNHKLRALTKHTKNMRAAASKTRGCLPTTSAPPSWHWHQTLPDCGAIQRKCEKLFTQPVGEFAENAQLQKAQAN